MVLEGVDVNYLAVLVCGIISIILGSLWYGPLFGNSWIRLMNFSKKEMSSAKKKGMAKLYIIAFIGSLVTAFVLGQIIAYSAISDLLKGMALGFWIWLGFVAPMMLGSVLWEGKPWKLYFINVCYQLVFLLIIGGVLAVWP